MAARGLAAWVVVIGGALLAAPSPRACAQLPAARLDAIHPAGAAPGSTVDVAIQGADLDDVTGLLFSHPGITAEPKRAPAGPFDDGPQPVPDTFVVTVAADVPPGRHAVRCQGRYGVSGERVFLVEALPHAVEPEGQGADEEIAEIAIPGIADGRFTGGADVDRWRIAGKRGQRLAIEVVARRVDSRAVPVVRLLGPDGGVVGEARGRGTRDPVLDVRLESDGEHVLVVSDALHGSGPEHRYRIRITAAPRLAYVFPPMVVPGSAVDGFAWGHDLPGGAPDGSAIDGRALERVAVRLEMPAAAATGLVASDLVEPWQFSLDGAEFRLPSPAGPSNPILVAAAGGPVTIERPGNDTPATAQPITLPAEVAGQFHPRRDADWYAFEARAGEVLWIEVWSQRLGLPTDPAIVVQQVTRAEDGTETTATVATADDRGPRAGGREFDDRSLDPALRFTAPADGTYRILVRDGYAALHDDPGLVYRLVVRPPRPDFRLVAVPVDAAGAVLVRKGGRAAVQVIAARLDGFEGEITLAAEGLPPGVSAAEAVIGPAVSATGLVLSADPGASAGTGMLRVAGRAVTPGGIIVREARLATTLDPLPFVQPGSQPAGVRARIAAGVPVTVSAEEPAPVALSIGAGAALETARGGVLKIPFAVMRQEGAAAPLTGFPVGLPPNVQAPQVAIGSANAGEFEVRLQAATPPGTYTFHLQAMQQGLSYARNPAAAARAKERAERFAAVLTESEAKATAAEQAAQQAAATLAAASAGTDEAAKATALAARDASDAALGAAKQRLQDARAEKQRRDQAAQQAQQQSQPRGFNVVVPSTTLTLRVAEHPLRVAGLPVGATAKPGGMLAIPFTLERLFGFAGDVTVQIAAPVGTKGIPAASATVPAAQTAGTLTVPLGPDATPGTHPFEVIFSMNFNGQPLSLPVRVEATVEAADPPAN